MQVNHAARKHAIFSASASSRWLSCAASIKENERYEDESNTSEFAQEGTRAHEVADLCLKQELNAKAYLNKTIEGGVVDEDMVYYVQKYLNYVREIREACDEAMFMCEQQVDYSHIAPDGFGTLDSAILDYTTRTLHVFDLKYGKGIEVDAEENTQGMLYASGVDNMYGFLDLFDNIVIHIVQPRLHNYSTWEISQADLIKWQINVVAPAVERAMSPKPAFNPSDSACQWCKAKHNCTALAEMVETEIISMFDEVKDDDDFNVRDEAYGLTPSQRERILRITPLATKFMKAVGDAALEDAMNGKEVQGFKLVEGRSSTKWVHGAEDELLLTYGDKIYKRELIGITEGRKMLSGEDFDHLTIKTEGKPKLVTIESKGVVYAPKGEILDMMETYDD